MKRILIILGLFASVSTFAQSPRIKLNQITKDTVKGSVLISSPSDSGMVYSRELYISYGVSDTVLILNGDTLAVTSGIISSVLSDGVTVLGNGTTGDELRLDTFLIVTVNALNDSLAGLSYATNQDISDSLQGFATLQDITDTLDLNARGYLTSEVDGSVTNEGSLTVGAGGGNDAVISSNTSGSSDVTISGGTNVTVTENTGTNTITIAASGGGAEIPVDTFVTIANAETITGAKTFTAALTQSGGDANFDSGTLFVDASENRVGIGTSSPTQTVEIDLENNGIANKFYIQDATRNGHQFGGISNDSLGYVFSADTSRATMYLDVFGAKTDLFDVGTGGDYQFFTVSKYDLTISGDLLYKKGSFGLYNFYDYDDAGYYYFNFNSEFGDRENVRIGIGMADPQNTIEASSGAALTAAGLWSDASDIRIKTNIRDLEYGLTELKKLRPVSYTHKTELVNQIGFIAQEINSIIPEVVNDQGKLFGISYGHLTALTVKAIQEQQEIIETQASEIDQLKTLIQSLTTRIENLENN